MPVGAVENGPLLGDFLYEKTVNIKHLDKPS